jgi:hypothetical protein
MEIAELIRAVLRDNGGDCHIQDLDGHPYSQAMATATGFDTAKVGSKLLRTSCRSRSGDSWSNLIILIEGDIVCTSSWMGEHTLCISDPDADLEQWILDLREGRCGTKSTQH